MNWSLNEWVQECHNASVEAGWWQDPPCRDIETFATKIALIHSEASEMLEGLRKGEWDKHLPTWSAEAVEAADLFIRLADYCGARGIDLEKVALEKLRFNRVRADHKPEARRAAGGKKI